MDTLELSHPHPPMLDPWYRRLIIWLAALFRSEPQRATPKPRILREWSTAWGKLYLLRRETPEAVPNATYQFIPSYKARMRLLLTCDLYKPLRDRSGGDRRAGHGGLRHGTPTRGHPVPSHRLSLSVVSPLPGSNLVQTSILWSYPVDFIGVNGVYRQPHGYAVVIVADLANLLLYEEYYKIFWESEINRLAAKYVQANHDVLMESV